jgi:hypothetical protein
VRRAGEKKANKKKAIQREKLIMSTVKKTSAVADKSSKVKATISRAEAI